MFLLNHKAPTATRTHLVADPSALVWRKSQAVMASVVRAIPVCAAGFEQAEDPM